MAALRPIQTFGRKKTAVAVASVTHGQGMIKVNGRPLEFVQPPQLRFKAFEPLLLLGPERFAEVDIRLKVRGGGNTAQVYAIRQAIAKGVLAYYQRNADEATRKELRDLLINFDRALLIADPRRREPKKFGGRGARARFQKSYR